MYIWIVHQIQPRSNCLIKIVIKAGDARETIHPSRLTVLIVKVWLTKWESWNLQGQEWQRTRNFSISGPPSRAVRVQQKYNSRHVYKYKFASNHSKTKNKKPTGKVNFNNIFYLPQYTPNIFSLVKQLLIRYFHSFLWSSVSRIQCVCCFCHTMWLFGPWAPGSRSADS